MLNEDKIRDLQSVDLIKVREWETVKYFASLHTQAWRTGGIKVKLTFFQIKILYFNTFSVLIINYLVKK